MVGVLLMIGINYLQQKRNPSDNDNFRKMDQRIDDLWEWHNVTDPSTGAKIWYIQKSLEDSVSKLAGAIESQTKVMQRMYEEMKDTRREIEYIMAKVNK